MPSQEVVLSMPFPMAGVDVSKAFVRQPQGAPGEYGQMATTPVAHNVRALDVYSGRVRGAVRPGLLAWLLSSVDSAPAGAAADDLTGLEAWHDSSVATSLWTDAGRTAQATLDDALVYVWDDLSGHSRHLTQATAGNRPKLKLAVQNGLNIVRFDGANDYISSASYVIAQPTTIFVVCKGDGTATQEHVLDGGVGGVNRQIIHTANNFWAYYAGSQVNSTIMTNTGYHVVLAVFNGNDSHLEVDGTTGTTASPTSIYLSTSQDGLTLGASSGGGNPWVGDVAEAGIYSRALSSSEIRALVTGLLAKWGL